MRLPVIFFTSAFMLTGLSAAFPVPRSNMLAARSNQPAPNPTPADQAPQSNPTPANRRRPNNSHGSADLAVLRQAGDAAHRQHRNIPTPYEIDLTPEDSDGQSFPEVRHQNVGQQPAPGGGTNLITTSQPVQLPTEWFRQMPSSGAAGQSAPPTNANQQPPAGSSPNSGHSRH